jgi:methyl-accepting chemotaxis protein
VSEIHTRGTIKRRLTLAVVVTTAASLLVASLLFGLYDQRASRSALIDRSKMLARVIAINSGVALAFEDDSAAAETLEGLAGAKAVVAAAIYDAQGQRFVRYLPPGTGESYRFPAIRSNGSQIVDGRLHVFQPIDFEGQQLGTLYLALDASELAARLVGYGLIVAFVMLGALAVSTWVAVRLRQQIATPLADLADASRAISDGDLSGAITRGGDDEIGLLARSFHEMKKSLRRVVGQVRQSIGAVSEVSLSLEERGTRLFREVQRQNAAIAEAADSIEQVGSSISELNDSAEQLAETSRETSSSIVEMDAAIGEIANHMDHLTGAIDTTSAAVAQVTQGTDRVVASVDTLQGATGSAVGRIAELSSAVRAVKDNAAETLSLSEDSAGEARQGRKAVTETIDAMGEIQVSFVQLSQRVERLAEKSQSIDEIVQVIKDVAEQTSLLALNASIIAAQAGEHGRAFSVVADQVSNLADRSHRSAKEIAELIGTVQEDTTAAVGAVEEGSAKVERGVQRSHVAGQVLIKIFESTQASTDRVREIVDATIGQADDLIRVDRAILEVREIVEEINRSAHDQHRATGEIADAVTNIRNLGIAVRQSTDEQRRGSRLITNSATNIAERVHEMAQALSAQSRGSETIQNALSVFNGVAEETTQGVESINQSVATLSERAKKLESEIGSFRTE